MKIEKFEQIQAWQKAKELTKRVYEVTVKGGFARDYGLRDQIRRASVSVMANIAEGHAGRTDKEFTQFLYISLGSVAELQSDLYIALELSYVSQAEFEDIYGKASETARLINGFIKYLQGEKG